MQNNLTTLANVNAWLGNTTTDDNALLTRLIASASRGIHAYLQKRPNLFQHTYSEVYDGPGRQRQMLRQWPVLSIRSLAVGTQTITASAAYGQVGYALEPWDGYPPGSPQALNLFGYAFYRGSGQRRGDLHRRLCRTERSRSRFPAAPLPGDRQRALRQLGSRPGRYLHQRHGPDGGRRHPRPGSTPSPRAPTPSRQPTPARPSSSPTASFPPTSSRPASRSWASATSTRTGSARTRRHSAARRPSPSAPTA